MRKENKITEKIRESQTDKVFLLWDCENFHTQILDIENISISGIKKIDDFLDNGAINPRGREIFSKINFRRSIVAKIKIKKNSIIKSNMLALKRPGTGIHPINIKQIINKKSIKNYDINEQILIKNLK